MALPIHSADESLAAQQQAERGVIEPADRAKLKKDRIALRDDRTVAQLNIAAGAALPKRESNQALPAERIDRDRLSRNVDAASGIAQCAAAEFTLRHVTQLIMH